ncbi:MAG: restriction endonuclease subunit S [Nitrosomonas sp. PRO4]|nr:restriction endonuclease subunit S [Nitrosomonas sp. PRO4]
MVPDGWKIQKVSECLERVVDSVLPEPNSMYREIGIRSHAKGIFHKEPVTGNSLGNKRVFNVHPNCFVVNIVFAWEQAIAMTSDDEVGMIASHRFPMFKPKKNRCDIKYITYFFKTPRGKYLLELASPGGAGRNKTLGQNEFARVEIPLPPTDEQKKIARILSLWDRAIEVTEKLLKNSQQQKKALMQQLLTGKKRLPGFGGGWEKRKIGEIARIEYGKSPKDILVKNGKYPVVGTGGVTGWTNTPMRKGHAVVIGRKGTIDRPQYIDRPFWAIDTIFYCYSEECISIKWFFYLMCSINLKKYNEASGVPSLSRETVKAIKVTIPETLEQQKIASVLSAADKEIEILEQKLDCLRQEKRALMQLLLTGKCRVKVDKEKISEKEAARA